MENETERNEQISTSRVTGFDIEALEASGISKTTIDALREYLHLSNSENIDTYPSMDNTEYNQSNHRFKHREYWEERFETEDKYDWLANFSDIFPILEDKLNIDDKILVLGCGNSTFSSDLYDAGYQNIVNIDFSQTVIHHMKEICIDKRPNMEWICMDMTELIFPSESFDVVIDKAAMDALMVDETDVWYPKQSVIDIVDKMCLSISRVLKSKGKYIQVSFAQPHFRSKYLSGSRAIDSVKGFYSVDVDISSRYHWNLLPHQVIEKEVGCLHSFMYTMIKE